MKDKLGTLVVHFGANTVESGMPASGRDRGVAGWARQQRALKEAALEPAQRIELALRLGLRARAFRDAAGR